MSSNDFPIMQEIAKKFYDSIESLSDHDLITLTRECDSLSEKNCWYIMHRLRRIVKIESIDIHQSKMEQRLLPLLEEVLSNE